MTAPFPVEQGVKRARSAGRDYAAASRKGWESRKRQALARAMGCPPAPPAPHAAGGTSLPEILARLRAAAERGR